MAESKRWTAKHSDGVQYFTLKSWEFFDDYIRERMLDYRHYIWRGQASADWPLEPTLDRVLRENGQLNVAGIREKHLQRFKYATRGRRGANPPAIVSENDWWALGQHYGLDTPLLDWTRSPFVAAYFAFTREDSDGASHRAVWAISQSTIARRSASIARKHNGPARAPIIEFVQPQSDENARLVSQGGLFTRGPDGVDIEAWVRREFAGDTKNRLTKIFIPDAERDMVLRSLNRMNINHLSLFPDLYGASKFVNVDLRVDKY